MEPTASNLEQKELSTSQQITQHMKISQGEQVTSLILHSIFFLSLFSVIPKKMTEF